MHSPSIGDVHDMNFLRVERGRRGARSLARAADDVQPHLFHRRVVVDRAGASLVADFKELGWGRTAHLVMAHRRELDRRVDASLVRELPFEELTPARVAASMREPWADEELAARLVEAKRRIARAVRMRNFAAVVRGRVAAYCELRCADGVAQIEDVNTLEEYRGSGFGRAVVQYALDEASREQHDLVFLEALADDWPRHLYARLGFEVVDERWLFTRYPHPLTQLRLATPRLELRLATRAELRELAEVARRGIHRRREMPFAVAWTDNIDAPRFVDDFVEFHEDALAKWRKSDWTLNLVAFHEGRPIGTQGMGAKAFARKRTVGTGSWLGRRWQRHGLGTEMRAAVLELAFRGLGAETATTGAVEGNRASLAVSRKLGYVDAGTATVAPRGEPLVEHKLKRTRRGWRSPVPVRITGLDDVRSLFGA